MTQRFQQRLTVLGVITAAALALGGCSSSSDSAGGGGDDGGGGKADSAVLTADAAQVDKYTAEQSPISVEPLKAKPAPGKKVAILVCPTPSCQDQGKAVSAGARKLGWIPTIYTSQLTPEGYQSTWNRMLQSPPDALFYQGLLPNSFIKAQLAKVKELGIPAVASGTAEKPNDVMRAVVANGASNAMNGTLIGDSIVVDAKGAAKAVFVSDPTLAFLDPEKVELKKQLTAAGGSLDVLDISAAEIGKAVPTQITSYLQSHPDVKYVVFPNADFGLGLPQALKAAGGLSVKIASFAPNASDLKDIKDGNQWISVAVEVEASGYRAIDIMARILEGSDFDPLPVGYHQILDKDNVTQTSASPVTPGSPDQFFKAWHVG